MGLLTILLLLQYRKRYELLQHPKKQRSIAATDDVTIPQAV